jgi:hypothetical protein
VETMAPAALKRRTPSWLEPVDLRAMAATVDTGRAEVAEAGGGPSTSTTEEDEGEEGDNVHAWMKEALKLHMSGGGEQQEVEIAEESLDVLTLCLGGILDRVLAEARDGNDGAKELTSIDIHRAIKSLFPDKEESEGRGLRPVLPHAMKNAWKLDKESLPKGVKKRKMRR